VSDDRRAQRLLRWYPRAWRDTYGEEFIALLLDEFADRPHSIKRSLDIVRGGTVARLSASGIVGVPQRHSRQSQLSLAWFALFVLVFLFFANALWSQLIIGWQWARPSGFATMGAMWVLTLAMIAFSVLAVAATFPFLRALSATLWSTRSRSLVIVALITFVAAASFVVGAIHFSHGWPGTNGHHWSQQGLVPGGVGAFAWSATLSITSYWAHLTALSSFPPAEILWMTLSPLALIVTVIGATSLVRRVELGPRQLQFEKQVARAAESVMALFIFGVIVWLVDGSDLPRNLFHRGIIDVVDLLAMIAALLLARSALARIRLSERSTLVVA
jgi:hypothetical protein